MMPAAIEFRAPESVREAVDLLAGNGEDARPVAGGTALAILLRQGLIRPSLLVGVHRVPELRTISADGPLRLGAAVPLRVAERDARVRDGWPLLAETFARVATPRIRNMATVGGGLAHADPAQDPPAAYLALDARVLVSGPDGDRSVPAARFFTDYYETALDTGEMVVGLEVPPVPAGCGSAFLKFTPRSVEDYATVSAAALVQLDREGRCAMARLALGAVGPTPILVDAEQALRGQPLTEERARSAAELARDLVDPSDDVRGSAGYKRDMAVVFARRALLAAARCAAPRPA